MDGFKNLIFVEKNQLELDFCNHCIHKFLQDEHTTPGLVGNGEIDASIKSSTDLYISGLDYWKQEDMVFTNSLYTSLYKYVVESDKKYNLMNWLKECGDTGFQIQQTKPGEFYTWHDDCRYETKRFLTVIWYLNTIETGGYTEFIDGTKIQPEAGKLLLFPATWNYVHRGYPPKEEVKYICTGWIGTKLKEVGG